MARSFLRSQKPLDTGIEARPAVAHVQPAAFPSPNPFEKKGKVTPLKFS